MSIKKHFISQNPNGLMVEFDFSQLEIRVLACASGSKNPIEDINNNVDMHAERAAEMYKIPIHEVTKKQRRRAKEFSFQLQYGASVKSIAEYWNENIPLVQEFFSSYFSRYPEIHVFHQELQEFVKDHAQHDGDYVDGYPVKRSIIPSLWDYQGITNGFFITESLGESYRGPSGGGSPSKRTYFPPTKIKNYPMQGGAADILLLILSRMRRILPKWEHKAHILLQVHDSILFDWHADANDPDLHVFIKEIKDLMESVPEILYEVFQFHCPVRFPVEVTVGTTWQERNPYEEGD